MKSIQLLLALPLVSAFSIDASSRRGFLTQSTAAIASLVATPIVAHAEDVDDLAMPSEEDEKARIAAEMEERIRRKRELQKKAAQPATFKDSLSKEQDKKKELQKSKEERRAALCEELGRGC